MVYNHHLFYISIQVNFTMCEALSYQMRIYHIFVLAYIYIYIYAINEDASIKSSIFEY